MGGINFSYTYVRCKGSTLHTKIFTPNTSVIGQRKKIQKAISRVRVMSTVRLQTMLAVYEYDGIILLEKVFGRGGAAGTRREVVDESNGLILERNDCTSAL